MYILYLFFLRIKQLIIYIFLIQSFFSKFIYATEPIINKNTINKIIINTQKTNSENYSYLSSKPTQNTLNKHNIPDIPLYKTTNVFNQNNIDLKTKIAKHSTQIGYILNNKNKYNNSINYVYNLSENLINEYITNLLNKYCKAKIQININKTKNIDILLPFLNKQNDFLFAQLGLRKINNKKITNTGLGYRQYLKNLMFGINSFYDYDITGKNSRFSIGYELWLDYIKFSANNYFRLTNWHKSNSHNLKEYDERPANGFDFNTEYYLPFYTQFGMFVKYEKYINNYINDNTLLLKTPKQNRSTIGIIYNPLPFITFKGKTSKGKFNDNHIEIKLTYNFLLPLKQQIIPNNINITRKLYGNRYDFIDRNYNIIMQYKKQNFLNISLPKSITIENDENIQITAVINNFKYGLKNILWSAPKIITEGGKIQKTSLNSIKLILPKNAFKTTQNKIKQYYLYAIGIDNNNNKSNTAIMLINLIKSQNIICDLNISPNKILLANDKDEYTATINIQNEKKEPLSNKNITFLIENFLDNTKITLNNLSNKTEQKITTKTDKNGKASILITSKISGEGTLKAIIENKNFINKKITFKQTENLNHTINLTLKKDKAIANGIDENIVIATVLDEHKNPIKNKILNISASNKAKITKNIQTTDNNGQIFILFTNTNSGESILTITDSNIQKNISTKFIQDINTSIIESVKLNDINTKKILKNTSSFSYTVKVVDINEKPIKNITIIPYADKKNVFLEVKSKTNENGESIIILTNNNIPVSDITVGAKLNTSKIIVNADKKVSFNLVNIKGYVINATNDKPLNNVKINIYKNNETNLIDTIYSDNNGEFKTILEIDNYIFNLSLKGFINLNKKIYVNNNIENIFPMSLTLNEISGRIILNWNKEPNDLDAHLYVPTKNNTNRVEVFFDQKQPNESNAILDIDKQHFPGIETISLLKLNKGKYLYFVHNCDEYTSSNNLEANVTINLNDGQTKTFASPNMPIKSRDCWIVFELDTTTDNAIINDINSISICP
ncbi:inverse autotransporter beta domain-containing protein [Candidatus Providencia siddallii]|uniref:Invasin n=1 Tax=Candidatus Providencia siddallii TaxID=1715285 RepID=A0ABM9NNC5_9GAMM